MKIRYKPPDIHGHDAKKDLVARLTLPANFLPSNFHDPFADNSLLAEPQEPIRPRPRQAASRKANHNHQFHGEVDAIPIHRQVPADVSRVQLVGQVIDTVVPLMVKGCQT